jgi:hypothetical protein
MNEYELHLVIRGLTPQRKQELQENGWPDVAFQPLGGARVVLKAGSGEMAAIRAVREVERVAGLQVVGVKVVAV